MKFFSYGLILYRSILEHILDSLTNPILETCILFYCFLIVVHIFTRMEQQGDRHNFL